MATSTHPKILVVGDGAAPTGLARVLRSIFEPIQRNWEIHQLAVNYFGDPHEVPWRLYPAVLGGDPDGIGRLPALVEEIEPELVFLLAPWTTLLRYLRALRRPVPLVAYCPLEGGPLSVSPEDLETLHRLEKLVFYTEFARRTFLAAARQSSTPLDWEGKLAVIPHGVDIELFQPLAETRAESRYRARRLLLGGSSDDFIVLNANRNQVRKRIDLTILGFAEFAHDKPSNVKLYLHMGLRDEGWDVLALCRRYGISDRLILTRPSQQLQSVTDHELNVVYNACDVGLNTAAGEGWGLVSFEHAATGAAQIVPRLGNLSEIWSGTAEMLETSFKTVEPNSLVEEELVAPSEVAQKLEALYTDPSRLREVGDRCQRLARDDRYRWSTISAAWQGLLEQVVECPPHPTALQNATRWEHSRQRATAR